MISVPRRPFGKTPRLPPTTPIIGLGCSSFSTFFWKADTAQDLASATWTPESLDEHHPIVQEWIQTIHFAVAECGITLLDTAPWYGHGTSEVVIGFAMKELLREHSRQSFVVNTKIGRYESDPNQQFDFSKEATLASVQRSLQRMKCEYIDVLQLHDPEFAPSLDQLMKETVPAMLFCRSKGWCKSLGMTGYPIEVQHQILQRTLEDFHGVEVWDQALTYGHYNLHNTSLFSRPIENHKSFADFCQRHCIGLLAAAPLSMGLLTHSQAPDWHPGNLELKDACRKAASICESQGVNISTLAIVFALSNPLIPCTILGMKNKTEAETAAALANRFHNVDDSLSQEEILKQVMTKQEYFVWQILKDPINGPFATIWKNGNFRWDGIECVREFWKQVDNGVNLNIEDWRVIKG
jgi:L-galactose dehydrogenase